MPTEAEIIECANNSLKEMEECLVSYSSCLDSYDHPIHNAECSNRFYLCKKDISLDFLKCIKK